MVQPYGYLENLSHNQNATSTSNYVSHLRQHMEKLSFTQMHVHSNMAYLPPNINVSEFVFVFQDMIKKSLRPNKDGLYKVLEKSNKSFKIEKN